MSLGVGSVALASSSSDVLKESLLDDMGMASVWSSSPPKDGCASSGDTSKPVSLSPKRDYLHIARGFIHTTQQYIQDKVELKN